MLEMQRNMYVLRRWWWLLLLAALAGGALAYLGTKVLSGVHYESTALVSLAPPPQSSSGVYVTSLSATADSQLVATLATARAALPLLPPSERGNIKIANLARAVTGSTSLDGQLLYVSVLWPNQAESPILANAVARAYIALERRRLRFHYSIIHRDLLQAQKQLRSVIQASPTGGPAAGWLRGQYAENAIRLSQNDADARIQVDTQVASMQIAQPAVAEQTVKVGPKATINALLGAALALLVALLYAYMSTSSYPRLEAAEGMRPVLTARAD